MNEGPLTSNEKSEQPIALKEQSASDSATRDLPRSICLGTTALIIAINPREG